MHMRQFSFTPMTSINLSNDITGLMTKCLNDRLGLKLVYMYLQIFSDFSVIFLMFSLKS